MGKLYYGDGDQAIDVPSALLAHVKVVVITKFRRGESFTFSWYHPSDVVGHSSTIWLQPSIPLRFEFDEADAETLDPALLRRLARDANSARGLTLRESDLPSEHVGSTIV